MPNIADIHVYCFQMISIKESEIEGIQSAKVLWKSLLNLMALKMWLNSHLSLCKCTGWLLRTSYD